MLFMFQLYLFQLALISVADLKFFLEPFVDFIALEEIPKFSIIWLVYNNSNTNKMLHSLENSIFFFMFNAFERMSKVLG